MVYGSSEEDSGKFKWKHKQTSTSTTYFASPKTTMQAKLFWFITSTPFEVFIVALMTLQFVLMIIDADASASEGGKSEWVQTTSNVILAVYVVELALRMYVFRADFWTCGWNLLDLAIVLSDVALLSVDLIIDRQALGLGFLRIFRLLRLARSVRVMLLFPQLALMVKGFMQAASIVVWGFLTLSIAMLAFGIFAVQVIHPINQRVASSGAYDSCERCGRAYETVGASVMTLAQQIICGDSWGLTSIPIMEESPAAGLFFIMTFAVIQLMLLNVILSVVVESMSKSALEDDAWMVKEHEKEFSRAASKLRQICMDLDSDNSGRLTKDELLEGFESNIAFRQLMNVMQIDREDCEAVFNIIDTDGSGDIHYEEFVTELHKMKSHDSHTILVFLKYYVIEIKRMTRCIAEELASGMGAEPSLKPVAAQHIDPMQVAMARPQDGMFEMREGLRWHPDLDQALSQTMAEMQQTLSEEWRLSVQELTAHVERQSHVLDEMRLSMIGASPCSRFCVDKFQTKISSSRPNGISGAGKRNLVSGIEGMGSSGGVESSAATCKAQAPVSMCCSAQGGKRQSIKAYDDANCTCGSGNYHGAGDHEVFTIPDGDGIGQAREDLLKSSAGGLDVSRPTHVATVNGGDGIGRAREDLPKRSLRELDASRPMQLGTILGGDGIGRARDSSGNLDFCKPMQLGTVLGGDGIFRSMEDALKNSARGVEVSRPAPPPPAFPQRPPAAV